MKLQQFIKAGVILSVMSLFLIASTSQATEECEGCTLVRTEPITDTITETIALGISSDPGLKQFFGLSDAAGLKQFCGKLVSSAETYPIKLLRHIDGDSAEVEFILIDKKEMSFTILVKEIDVYRLLGVDTPEKTGKTRIAGLKATKYAENWYKIHKDPFAYVFGKGKFGHPLVVVCPSGYAKLNDCLNAKLVTSGNANHYCGGKRDQFNFEVN